ncbi:MAG: sugar phosphate isomerase/epimerase family protein [Planctomycetaceae bacterium]
MAKFTRRDFGFIAGAAVAAPHFGTRAVASAKPLPPQRDLKLALAAYSFNQLFSRRGTPEQIAAAKMKLEDFIDYCAELGVEGTELTGYYFPKNITPKYLASLKQRTFRAGLEISGTAIGNDFCLPDGEKRDAQLAMCREWVDHAAAMGAPVIRIFAGRVAQGDSEEAAIERCVAGINESLEYAATKGVFLAMENHGGITATPDQMMKIIDGIKDKSFFGINFDSGNFRTDDPYRDLERIAPLAINAQLKVSMHPQGGKKEPADFARIVKMLRKHNYRGYVVLEFEENVEDPKAEIAKHIDQLRELVRA